MFSKFQWGLSQRAPCTDPSGVTDKGWIVEPLESSVSRQCWWAKSRSLGQNLMESYNCAERLQGLFMAKFLTQNSTVRSWVFMLQGAALSSTSTTLARPDEKELGTQPPWGRQKAAAFPPLHPDISPGSLQPLWKRSTAGFSLPASCPKKCRKKVSFPQQVLTGLAETCPREIGRSAHQHAVSEKLVLFPPPHTDTAPRAAADTEGLCSHQRTDTMEASLHPDGLTCQCISASWPKARGDGFGVAKPVISTDTGQYPP